MNAPARLHSADTPDLIQDAMVRQARRSFWAFRQFIHPDLKRAWWQRDAAHRLQRFYEDMVAGKRPRLLLQAPPQHGKSMMAIDFLAWLYGQNPNLASFYASFSDRLGVRANLWLQRIIRGNSYSAVFPETRLPMAGQPNPARKMVNTSMIEFLDADGMFRNTTVKGPINGEGMGFGLLDDPIKNRADAQSETTRNKTWDWLTDDFMTRLTDDAGVLGIMTRWHIDDPFGRLQERLPNVIAVRYPALAEVDDEHRKKGEPLMPEHKSLDFLMERKASMTAANFEALYQQNPILAEGNMFKRWWFEIIPTAPQCVRYMRAWDLAGTEGDGAFTVGVLLGEKADGGFVVLDVVREQAGPARVRQLIKNTAVADGRRIPGSIPQDPGQAGKTQVADYIKMLAGYNYTASPESGDKELRAEPFAAQAEVGNVQIVRGAWNNDYLDELNDFPDGLLKDQVDASSRAFSELLLQPKHAATRFALDL